MIGNENIRDSKSGSLTFTTKTILFFIIEIFQNKTKIHIVTENISCMEILDKVIPVKT